MSRAREGALEEKYTWKVERVHERREMAGSTNIPSDVDGIASRIESVGSGFHPRSTPPSTPTIKVRQNLHITEVRRRIGFLRY